MTERMENFRLRQKQKGLVQVRLWVKREDQVDFAKEIAVIKNIKEPKASL